MSVAISKKPPAPRRRTRQHAHAAYPLAPLGPPPDKRFIFVGEVLERLGNVSSLSLQKWITEGVFPPAYVVGGQRAWIEADVNRWMAERPLHDNSKYKGSKRS